MRSGKQEFGDWGFYDDKSGTTVVLDNTNICLFTAAARKIASQAQAPGELRRPGHPAAYAAATARRKTKFEAKATGCDQRGQIFLPLINTHAGGFIPQDPATLPVHTEAAKRYFGAALAKTLGRVGTRPRSIEEGLIRRWSRQVADVEEGGKGVFDATLCVDRAAGLMTSHTHRAIAHAAIRASANAALKAIRKNRWEIGLAGWTTVHA